MNKHHCEVAHLLKNVSIALDGTKQRRIFHKKRWCGEENRKDFAECWEGLKVNTVKITEFKENKSIRRLDLSGSRPGEPAAPVSYDSG